MRYINIHTGEIVEIVKSEIQGEYLQNGIYHPTGRLVYELDNGSRWEYRQFVNNHKIVEEESQATSTSSALTQSLEGTPESGPS